MSEPSATLSVDRTRLLRRLLSARGIAVAGKQAAPPPLVRVERVGELPLSFAQERLWFIDRLEPGSALYNVSLPATLAGGLAVGALRRAMAEVVRRHEVLRSRYASRDGGPVQLIDAPPAADGAGLLPVVDLGGLPLARSRQVARQLAAGDGRRPFDLARGPVFRATLVRLAAAEHWLAATLHHIVCDAASIEVLLGEIGALYQAFAAGQGSPLGELPVQYVDYAAWQRSYLSGGRLAAEVGYWRGVLGSEPPVLELPTDRPRPATPTHRGTARRLHLAAAVGAGL